MALWPVAIPTAVLLGYHALKWRLTGHFLVSPEFRDANLGRVSGPLQYLERMWHSVNQLIGFHHPCFWMLIMTAVLTLVIAIRLREPDFAGRLRSALRVVQPACDPARFFRVTSVGETAALAWLMAVAHLGFWSLRQSSLGMVHSPFQVVWDNGQVIFLPGNSLPGSNPSQISPLPGYRQSAACEKWRVTDFTFAIH